MKKASNQDNDRLCELRAWFKWAAEDEFTEYECRVLLSQLGSIVPQRYLEELHRQLYNERFVIAEWKTISKWMNRKQKPTGGAK